ncbi:hypothetical protein Nepgr_019890 [Nepenthes gracilis]|uniref:Uncharacterized protein n=1 Tax=Nepenthes gracilis TaxID=150966 RepID=A0AAD3SWM8_NEPGR|nr:hypothetical protein Nepgr_019890 [Nepenthes gracilis]
MRSTFEAGAAKSWLGGICRGQFLLGRVFVLSQHLRMGSLVVLPFILPTETPDVAGFQGPAMVERRGETSSGKDRANTLS